MPKKELETIKPYLIFNGKQFYTSAQLAKLYGYKNKTSITNIVNSHNIESLLNETGNKLIQKDSFDYWFLYERDAQSVNKRSLTKIDLLENETNKIPYLPQHFQFNSNNVIIGADSHIPFIDVVLFKKMLEFSKLVKAKTFIHNGDYFDQDAFKFFHSELPVVPWDIESELGDLVCNCLVDTFSHIIFCMGNHDKRLFRLISSTGKNISVLEPFKKLMTNPKVQTTIHQRIVLNCSNFVWNIEHPKTLMKTGSITTLKRYARIGGNIVEAHGHRMGIETAPNGKDWIINLGMLGDPQKIFYHSLPTSHPEWDCGFMWIKNGIPILIWKQTIDFWLDILNGKVNN